MLRTIGMNRRRFVQAGGALAGLAFLPWEVRRAAAQDDPEAGTVESEPIEGKTNVTWWSHTGEAFIEANKEMIARFEEANPDVHIVYQHFPYDVYYAKLPAAYASQEASDVQQMFGTWVADYAVNGLLDPVPEDLAAGMADTFLPATIGGYTLDGVAYGMPNEFNIENGGMLVNDALIRGGRHNGPTGHLARSRRRGEATRAVRCRWQDDAGGVRLQGLRPGQLPPLLHDPAAGRVLLG